MRTIQDIAQDVATQDNTITELPIFIVQQRKRLYGIDDSYATESVWVDKDDWSEVLDPEKIKELDDAEENGDEVKGYERCGIRDEWEFVTACFTRRGCAEYLRVNGHNLTDPRIYVASGYRNDEWKTMREFLLARAEPPTEARIHAKAMVAIMDWIEFKFGKKNQDDLVFSVMNMLATFFGR